MHEAVKLQTPTIDGVALEKLGVEIISLLESDIAFICVLTEVSLFAGGSATFVD